MRYLNVFAALTAALFLAACGGNTEKPAEDQPAEQETPAAEQAAASDTEPIHYPEETHLVNIRQLTFGGNNAEAYWSFDDEMLVFQSDYSGWGNSCDQIYVTKRNNTTMGEVEPQMVSTGLGRTTCSYFLPGNQSIVYASTHLGGSDCPPVPEHRQDGKYVWPIYESFDIFTADLEGNMLGQLTNEPGYDAEATVSPTGDRMVFTSMRSGDLELYTCNVDGTDIVQITHELGYDGGAFFSPDGTKLVWRASRPQTEEEKEDYKALLKQGLVTPTQMEIFVADADGSNVQQVTDLGQANWAPFFHPSGEKIIFASNHKSERGFPFNLYLINIDGTGLEQITHDGTFDAFPVFSNDGKYLVFSSNRANGGTRDTNLFLAEWKE